MLKFEGRYNRADVFTNDPDETTVVQIKTMLDHPAFADTTIKIMPDCHAGAGSVIGFTANLGESIIPNVVGVDIGCGIYSWNIGKQQIKFDKLDRYIRNNIPHGFDIRSNVYDELPELNSFIKDELSGSINKLNLDFKKVVKSIGSLGSGNHFIEIGVDEQGDNWLTIHSGSRNFGLQVARYFQDKAKKFLKENGIKEIPAGLEYLPLSEGGGAYLETMHIAQKMAHFNRMVISRIIIEDFLKADVKREVFSVHNYIDFKDNIIRKGAIKAYEGDEVVIPFNMKDGLIIGKGKGAANWNYSAPHGAGRIMSRRKAKSSIDIDDFKKSMKGIYTSCISKGTLDESPFVYKSKKHILENIKETVDVELWVKPVYNFKAE